MSRIKQTARGFGYIRKGFGLFFRHRRLWWYAIIPTIINLLFLILLFFLLSHYFGDLTGWIFGSGQDNALADPGFFAKVWGGTLTALIYIAKAIIFIILLIFLLVVTFIFSMILAGPFNDVLSERVEQIVTGGGEIPFSWNYFAKSIWRSIVVELQKAGFFLTIPLLLLILNIIPVLGSVIYLILASLFAAFDIGFNFMDYPMSRKLWTFRQRIRLGWSNRYYLVGFGSIALIPFFPYIFSAPLVVGGTLLFEDLKPSEKKNC